MDWMNGLTVMQANFVNNISNMFLITPEMAKELILKAASPCASRDVI